MYAVNVVLNLPLRQNYTYLSTVELFCGQRVLVEFITRKMIALVVNSVPLAEYTGFDHAKLKPVLTISEDEFNLPQDSWQLCEFAANYYHHPLGCTLFAALPTPLRIPKAIRLNPVITKEYYQALPLVTPIKFNSSKQQALYQQLQQHALTREEIKQQLQVKQTKLIDNWLNKNIITLSAPPAAHIMHEPLTLNEEQQQVVQAISQQQGFHAALLYGVTGSGKTEVFLHLIAHYLALKQQILILIPEINLTPQLAKRFMSRFPSAQISLINSEINDMQRLNAWLSAKQGQAQIILGTRLSIFTPMHNLGLIIVDEEHDASFKQNDLLRYHARDLAVWRAKQLNIPIILASATPSLESIYNYKIHKYQLYRLSQRAITSAKLPQIQLINLQHHPVNHAGISAITLEELKKCLERKELALVFINRRGYAPVITCYECGWVGTCRYCSTNMVYHHQQKQLRCHHCSYHTNIPPFCPNCHNQYLHTIGHGTQKLEEFLGTTFPNAKIKRIDRDSTQSKKAWQEIYNSIAQDQLDILIGTQMLAKGHDFAKLSLVIGLNLDQALFSYDFRASEDMFNLLTQVAGRAGRANTAGLVLLQTNYPQHQVYQFLQQHDFNSFVNYTLQERQANSLPPFSFQALIKFSHSREKVLLQAMHDLNQIAKSIVHFEVTLFQPVFTLPYKSHNRFRAQMLLSSKNRNALHNYLTLLSVQLAQLKLVSCAIDVDPLEI